MPSVFPFRRVMAPTDDDHAALRCAASGEAALCTLVGIDGSFSRRLGAQIAITGDGRAVGSLADGCLERELAGQVQVAKDTGGPRILRYGRGSPFIDFRLPCGSGLDILIDPAPRRDELAAVVTALEERRPASLALATDSPGLLKMRRFVPELRLLVFGNGSEPEALARLAAHYGIEVVVRGPDHGLSLGGRPDLAVDPWTAIVLLFHDHEWERALLEWALSTQAYYIGALGGRVAREQRHAWLSGSGFAPDSIRRVRSPVGLIPGARDARVLALSVLADVVAAYEGLRT